MKRILVLCFWLLVAVQAFAEAHALLSLVLLGQKRLYAAEHDGKLPARLADVLERQAALRDEMIALAARRNPQWSLNVFVSRHVVFYTTSFMVVGAYLLLDGFELHIPKGYLYGAMGFSAVVECLNLWAKKRASLRMLRE